MLYIFHFASNNSGKYLSSVPISITILQYKKMPYKSFFNSKEVSDGILTAAKNSENFNKALQERQNDFENGDEDNFLVCFTKK
jgi:hypothetical protein